jgi:hypothetical protein
VSVEVADIELANIELRRTFSGTLQAYGEFVVAPMERLVTRIVEDQVRYRFSRVPSVAQVDPWGGFNCEYGWNSIRPSSTASRIRW